MKTADQIQRAHDLLVGLILDEEVSAQVINADDQEKVIIALDALCWVLGHNHNIKFAENIRQIELRLEALGIRIERLPEMVYPNSKGEHE